MDTDDYEMISSIFINEEEFIIQLISSVNSI